MLALHQRAVASLLILLGSCPLLAQQPQDKPREHRTREVIILAKQEERKLRTSGLPVSIISRHQLAGTASSIEEVVARTAGVTIRQTGGVGSSSRFSVRGLEGKRIGVYIDEQPIGELSDLISLNDIPLDMIERIEVYKGVVPNKLGGSSMGGAVNVVIKDYPPLYFDGAYELGSYGTHRLNSVLKRHDKHTGLTFGIGGGLTYSRNDYEMDLPQRPGVRVKREHDRFRKILGGGSVQLKDRWGWEELKLELFTAHTYRELQGIAVPIDSAYNYSHSYGGNFIAKRQDFLIPGLDLHNEFALASSVYGLWDHAMRRRDWDGSSLPPTSPQGGELQSYPSEGRHHSLVMTDKLYLNYQLSDQQRLNFGARLSSTQIHPRDDYQRQTLGYEATRPGSTFTATLGLGHEFYALDRRLLSSLTAKWYHYSSKGEVPNFVGSSYYTPTSAARSDWGLSEALRYALTPQLMLKAAGAWELRLPSSEELLGNGYLILPSPSLAPERSLSANLGLLYQREYDYGRTELETNVFVSRVDNMVRLVESLGNALLYANFGQMRTLGLELEAKSDLTPWLYAYGNVTYQDLRDVRRLVPGTERANPTRGKRIPNIPYLMSNLGLELHRAALLGGAGSNTRLLLDASYVHRYSYDFALSEGAQRDIPSSFNLDAGLEQSFGSGRWTITAKVKNLLDRQLYSEYFQPLAGRSFSLKLRYLMK